MNAGIGRFRIVYGNDVFVPTDFVSFEPDIENVIIERRSPKSKDNKVIPKATYYNANAKVKRLTAAEIAFFRTITGKQVRLYPHIDVPGISYYCNVISAPIRIENKKPWINVCELRFEGVYNLPILTTITAKSFTVTSPYNDTWVRNWEFEITWTSVSIAADDLVKIELFKGGVLDSVISASTANDGSFLWTVPAGQATGTDYQIKITQLSDLYVFDYSGYLTIDSEYWEDEDGYVLDENGEKVPIN